MDDERRDIAAELTERVPQPSAAVRLTQPMSELDLAALFDTHLPNIADRVADLGGEPAGAPYGRYHQFGPDVVDVEIGIPVVAPVANLRPLAACEPGELGGSALPGGRLAVVMHRGAYEGLPGAYDRLRAWIAEKGEQPSSGPWESYLDDPSEVEDAGELRTEVCWPLA